MGMCCRICCQFLEDLQQSLILKDVFVNYADIKVESRIGEGSFGVVFKATFRGAQVDVVASIFYCLMFVFLDHFYGESCIVETCDVIMCDVCVVCLGVFVLFLQVALKQMRSPLFAEITQNDIEEFRKEAYMMSRCVEPPKFCYCLFLE